ncbi:MAG: TetR family transcriptional regulator [Actinobacteria bacterium]|nr:TetR family transcriptional regulator [Actinomycetota bacterium]
MPDAAPLTKDRIVQAALDLIDHDGLEATTMRRLAEELGVQAPSLYNHMRSKQALLDAVAEHVFEAVDTSAFQRLGWREALESWAWSYYEALSAHPNLVPHLVVAFGRLDAALSRADQVYAGLRQAGWSASRATRIAAGMRYAVYGAALGSFARGFTPRAVTFPHLHEIERMQAHSERVDRGALRLLIENYLDGLESIAPPARGTGD